MLYIIYLHFLKCVISHFISLLLFSCLSVCFSEFKSSLSWHAACSSWKESPYFSSMIVDSIYKLFSSSLFFHHRIWCVSYNIISFILLVIRHCPPDIYKVWVISSFSGISKTNYPSILALLWELVFHLLSTFLKSEDMLGLRWRSMQSIRINYPDSALLWDFKCPTPVVNAYPKLKEALTSGQRESAIQLIFPLFTQSSSATISNFSDSLIKRVKQQWYSFSLLLSDLGLWELSESHPHGF